MKIAFICKRWYMGGLNKDVILDRYGRLYEIPFQLALLGHNVRGFCLDYRGQDGGTWQHETPTETLIWESASLGYLRLFGLSTYPFELLRKLRQFQPNLLFGASDIPHLVLTRWLANRLRIHYAVDIYDNFESFGQARIPGMVAALRKAARDAKLVVVASDRIEEQVRTRYHAKGRVLCMPNFIDKNVFYPKDSALCRQAFGLPDNAILVGAAGGLTRSRGIGLLYQAWDRLAPDFTNLHLVLAGCSDMKLPVICRDRVHYLGILPQEKTADLFNALDVGVIYLANTEFGRYCFPQKAHEMLSCHLPVVAANLGAMPKLLGEIPEALYEHDSVDDLARAILWQMENKRLPRLEISDWRTEVRKIHDIVTNGFSSCCNQDSNAIY